MIEHFNQWAPLLTILLSLGGLQLTLYRGLRTDMRSQNEGLRTDMRDLSNRVENLASGLSDVRERLASLETRVEHLETRLTSPPT